MTRERLQKLIWDFSDESPLNILGESSGANASAEEVNRNNYAKNNLYYMGANPEAYKQADFGEYNGIHFFERPIFSIAGADDPWFIEIKRPEVVGKHHLLPQDWLPSAKSVISVFIPYNHDTVESNSKDNDVPSMEWLYTRIDGQRFLLELGAMIRDALIADGHKAITPQTEDMLITRVAPEPIPGSEQIPRFSSNWSERHVATVTGLGTFGLSTNFISKIGCAGRLISIVTDWGIEPDVRDYEDWLEYCNRCGSCIHRCQANAHYSDKAGKNHAKCGEYVGKASMPYWPRYACGKCQSGIPCAYKPMRTERVTT